MSLSQHIKGLEHVGIPVCNISRSEQFYSKLGFKLLSREHSTDEDGSGGVSFLGLNGLTLELYQKSHFPEGTGEAGIREAGAIDHLALEVTDIKALLCGLQQLGIETEEDGPRFLPFHKNGVSYINVIGPDGEKIEFIQKL
ncbi:MAG: VOC family protein [Spirochaetales bacterium]|nr:VOC family protein [Spirochaetales bacterium]